MRNTVFGVLLVAGCATSGPAARYSGEPFDLQARGGRLSGQVCGMDLTLAVERRAADAVELSGFADGKFPIHVSIEKLSSGGRTITGALGTRAGDSAVDLRVGSEGLDGRVGFRKFDLRPSGDTLSGTMLIAGALDPSDAVLEGRSQLDAMPLDAQAALLPALLSCNVQPVGRWGRSSLMVRVGGPGGALPHQSSSVYTRD